MKNVHK